MSVRFSGAVALAVVVTAGPALGAQAVPAPPAPPVTILPLGDSITHGHDVPGGYRIRFEDAMAERGVAVDLVGSLQDGPAGLADPDHEGHPGLRIDELVGVGTNAVRTYRPRFVLLLAGTNDVLQGHDVAGAPARLVGLVDRLLSTSPTTTVIVSTLPPLGTSPTTSAAVPEFNARLREALRGHGSRVVLSEAGGAVPGSDLADGIHPTRAGYDRLGDGLATTLLGLLAPRPTPVSKPAAAPATNPPPRRPAPRPAARPGQLRAQALPPQR